LSLAPFSQDFFPEELFLAAVNKNDIIIIVITGGMRFSYPAIN
jgi:hypothetical protein